MEWSGRGLEEDPSSRGGEGLRRILSERNEFSALPNDSPEARTTEEAIFDREGILELSTMDRHSLWEGCGQVGDGGKRDPETGSRGVFKVRIGAAGLDTLDRRGSGSAAGLIKAREAFGCRRVRMRPRRGFERWGLGKVPMEPGR